VSGLGRSQARLLATLEGNGAEVNLCYGFGRPACKISALADWLREEMPMEWRD